MKIFQRGHCDYPLFFENYRCELCGHLTGYSGSDRKMAVFIHTLAPLIIDREKKRMHVLHKQ